MDSAMADLGIAMDGRAPLSTVAAQAQAAEEGGASTLWLACHLYLRDPVTTAALALAATKKIRIALMAMSPYATHPVYIAMAAASLDEIYPGRVILCLGVGAPADLKAAGIDSTRLGPPSAIRRPIGFVLRGAHHAENIRLGGASLDQAELATAYAAENWSEVDRLVSDDVVRRHAACGTPREVRARLEEYR